MICLSGIDVMADVYLDEQFVPSPSCEACGGIGLHGEFRNRLTPTLG